jgi:2-polyprenyl-3-methyl-5-hydroxy-6-metoxy-1,4-benzoquinol methylase
MKKRMFFDFGRNWQSYSDKHVDSQRLSLAVDSLDKLVGAETISGRNFLDIGCGSGLFSIAAGYLGASKVAGFDFNPKSVNVSRENLSRLSGELPLNVDISFEEGSILNDEFIKELGQFEIVYSWGVLHHTGEMWEAIRKSAGLVSHENGWFVIAIYNHHWSSFVWEKVKYIYNLSPAIIRMILNYLSFPPIVLAKWITTRQNPFSQPRGMDFWFDILDWLGGYPYEFAGEEDVIVFVEQMGFELQKVIKPPTPTGCNEFVFKYPN